MNLQFRVLKDLGNSLLVHVASMYEGQDNWVHLGVLCMPKADFANLSQAKCQLVFTSDIAITINMPIPVSGEEKPN